MAGMSPPGPFRCGSTTCRVNPAATAASKALPPRSSTAMPDALASQCVDATMPKLPCSSGRVVNSLKVCPPPQSSQVASRLAAVDGPAGSVHEARRPRTQEGHDLGDLLRGAKTTQRQLAPNEGGDALGVGHLPAMPGTALEQNRAGSDCVHRHAGTSPFAGQRGDKADLSGFGSVVRGWPARFAAVQRRYDDDPSPAGPSHGRQCHEAEPQGRVQVAGHRLLHLRDSGVHPAAAGTQTEVVDEDKGLPGSGQRRLAALFGGQVYCGGDASDLRRNPPYLWVGPGGHDHLGSLGGELSSDRHTYAPGGTGHQGRHAPKAEV